MEFSKMAGITLLVFALAGAVIGGSAWLIAMLVYWDAFWPDMTSWTTWRAGFATVLVFVVVSLGQSRQ